jgi:GH25 family lysozyme M1 (1,4-beta-N-acetylmuramidase)
MARAFGLDISKYQSSADGTKKLDFNKIKAHSEEVTFIAARAGVSWGYVDPLFAYYWSEMARIQVGRMAYFVVYFGESALSQMDALFKTLEGKADWAHDRIALDAEVAGINTRARITATTQKCLDICKARTGRYPLIYSRASWIDSYLSVDALPALDWWLATYKRPAPAPFFTAEHPGPPLLPRGVRSWLIHQTGDRCRPIGAASATMDYDRWNGEKADVLRYFGSTGGQNPQPTPQVLYKAKCVVAALYKRGGPGTNYPVVGSLSLGDVVSVYEEKGTWLRIDPSAPVWCSGAAQYMQRLDPQTPLPQVLFKGQCIVRALYKRAGPGKQHQILGALAGGQIVSVYEVKDGWWRVSQKEQVWVSGAAQYMRRV